jgi:hypothetical protein
LKFVGFEVEIVKRTEGHAVESDDNENEIELIPEKHFCSACTLE